MMYSLVKKTKNCQICKRSFANGKALGGHMRSHTQKPSLHGKVESSTVWTDPSLQTFDKLGADTSPRETDVIVGPKPDLSKGGQQMTDKRNILKDLEKVTTHEFQGSLTDVQTALLLVEMSKRKWPENCIIPIGLLVSTPKGKSTEKYIEVHSEDDHEYVDKEADPDVKILTSNVGNLKEDVRNEDDDESETYPVARERRCKKRSRECTCDICGKVLRSYQALGGHRTSHTRKRLNTCDKNDDQAAKTGNELRVKRQYKCKICSRVFESGQALGGHRKVHYAFL